MFVAHYVFWTCLLLIVYTYVLYPCFLFFLYTMAQIRNDAHYLLRRHNRRRVSVPAASLPPVTLVIPAHNEAAHLPRTLDNLRQLDYPRDKLHVLFVSDGSTDGTNEILRRIDDPHIDVLLLPQRAGKANALNVGVARARDKLLIFTDASTRLAPTALKQLVRHFVDPTVGVVCGALSFQGGSEFRQTEGVYWRYESMLRLMEARLGVVLTASGAIYALRRQCYRPLARHDLIEDFVIPMHARTLGFRVLFDPEAEATELAAPTVKDEFTRRVRLAIGSFHGLGDFSRISMSPLACLSFFSHKLLRWVLPFLMLGLLASSAFLWNSRPHQIVLLAQVLFYLWATIGFLFRRRMREVPGALLAYFLVAINAAFLVGFIRFLTRRTETAWQRVN